ncbi:MAG: NmrA family NAD(P)-binding protein [Hyphomicrobium sp.]|nr:NmrA family NAD(P)-binding protein [Hyphomicrobium sp.]
MYAVTGITGQVGGAAARRLLEAGQPVRAVIRNVAKCALWTRKGCEIAVADMQDADALARAFKDADGVFILPPSEFDPSPGFPEALAVIEAVKQALETARPRHVVCLSTIGAQAAQPNLLTQRQLMEEELGKLNIPMTFLRPAWFMENFAWDVASARDEGVIASFLQPLDKPVPMIATADIGLCAAQLLQEKYEGKRIVELEAAKRYSPNDVAATFAELLGHPVSAEPVPRETWGALFKSQGMKDPIPRIQMLDGFNEGWIEFERSPATRQKGTTGLATVLKALIDAGE